MRDYEKNFKAFDFSYFLANDKNKYVEYLTKFLKKLSEGRKS
jgi:hypothetical protein